MSTSSSTTRVRARSHVHARAFDGELVILDLDRGKYFALDEIGTTLWSEMQAGASLGDVAQALETRYEVGPEQLLMDLTSLCDAWIEQNLVEVLR